MTIWNDFNDAEQQQDFDLIPKGTIARLRLTVKPGGYDDPGQGWIGGYATQSYDTGSVYLACEFVVLEGEYARRKVFSNIGLHSPKGSAWEQMGRSFIRAVLNSARNVHPKDASPQASAARRIKGFHELDGIEFTGRIDLEKDSKGDLRNVVKFAIEPGQPEYAPTPGLPPKTSGGGTSGAPAHPAPTYHAPTPPPKPPVTGKPSWAQ